MSHVMEMYELDLELSYRLLSPVTIERALKDQGISAGTVHRIGQLCEAQQFHDAAFLAVNSGCNFEMLDAYLESNAFSRKLFLSGI